ncbi:MAG: arginine--tRNA ligase [bacterium]|nr:arginine--tRNA ligase [bacterium]
MRAGIEKIIASAIQAAIECGELSLEEMPDPSVERPKDIEHGDWASSVAMKLAKPARMNPRKIAEIICSHISDGEMIESTEIAGPGFINFKLKSSAFQEVIRKARVEGADFGRVDVGEHKRIQVEFVSANPTGPMHVGHGRWAALGNSLCNILDHAGWDVSREFYINDAGSQMDNFANSVDARYQQLCGIDAELPENGYGGSYVTAIAQRILDAEGDKWASASSEERSAAFKEIAYKMMLDNMRELLASIGVQFDVWFSERSLYAKDDGGKSAIEKTLEELDAGGYLYAKDDATWFRSTDFGDDKDRVLVKQDGSYTYFMPDIAYHQNKFSRGFDRVIDILGADHHGYVVRIKSAMEALGNGGKLDILLGQLVNLFRDGEAVRMSKRSGEMITFEELIEEVGADATKYLMLAKSADQPIDFDISVAKKQDSSNPVYYVQYAHARICSILRRAGREVREDADLSLLVEPSEIGLARKISEFSEVVESCAKDFAPYRMTHYIEALAASFHQFYTNCQVLVDDARLADARLYLCDATRNVIATALGLVGVTAPERM